jgi:hypothetical protein
VPYSLLLRVPQPHSDVSQSIRFRLPKQVVPKDISTTSLYRLVYDVLDLGVSI